MNRRKKTRAGSNAEPCADVTVRAWFDAKLDIPWLFDVRVGSGLRGGGCADTLACALEMAVASATVSVPPPRLTPAQLACSLGFTRATVPLPEDDDEYPDPDYGF